MTMTELQKQAVELTEHWTDIANEKYCLNLISPRVSFKLKGRTAGKACISANEVRYNAVLLEENGEAFLKRTVPHEVAHIVAHKLADRDFIYRIKPHGEEWEAVMRDFGLNSSRCHRYDTTNSRQPRKRSEVFEYKCSCRTFKFTIIRHRRVLKGARYTCKSCRSVCRIAA